MTGADFTYCIRNEKTEISTMSVIGMVIYIPSTLPDIGEKQIQGLRIVPLNAFSVKHGLNFLLLKFTSSVYRD